MVSYSAIGRATDPPAPRPVSPSHESLVQRSMSASGGTRVPKVKLRPWDGVAIVDAVLADAHRQQAGSVGPREILQTSSPRVNPVLVVRDHIERYESLAQGFLLSMSRDVPRAVESGAPALLAAAASARVVTAAGSGVASSPSGLQEQQNDEDHNTNPFDVSSPSAMIAAQRRTAGGSKLRQQASRLLLLRSEVEHGRSLNASSCFLSPAIRDRPDKVNAPPVGQYAPKFQVVLRRAPSAAMGRAARHGVDGSRSSSAMSAAKDAATDVLKDIPTETLLSRKSTMVGGRTISVLSKATGTTPASFDSNDEQGAQNAEAMRLARRRQMSPAFRNTVPRFDEHRPPSPRERAATPLPPWPLPTPGSRPHTAGTISTLARASAFETRGGPDALLDPAVIDRNRPAPRCFARMARSTSRETHRGTHQTAKPMRPEGGAIEVEKIPLAQVLSTHSRPPTPVRFEKQTTRPATHSPSAELAPLPPGKLDPPRGFVDIKRMVYSGERHLVGDPAFTAQRPHTELEPSYSLVHSRAPTPVIGVAARDTGLVPPRAASPDRAAVSPVPAAAAEHVSYPRRAASAKGGASTHYSTSYTAAPHHEAPAVDLWSPVKRRPPSVSMRGTNRSAPVMRTTKDVVPSTAYDNRPPERIASPDLGRLLSRPARDLRYKTERAVDAVYEIAPPKACGGALSFDKCTVRR